jgi:hypothetical protein
VAGWLGGWIHRCKAGALLCAAGAARCCHLPAIHQLALTACRAGPPLQVIDKLNDRRMFRTPLGPFTGEPLAAASAAAACACKRHDLAGAAHMWHDLAGAAHMRHDLAGAAHMWHDLAGAAHMWHDLAGAAHMILQGQHTCGLWPVTCWGGQLAGWGLTCLPLQCAFDDVPVDCSAAMHLVRHQACMTTL